jgi:hypothetical protein
MRSTLVAATRPAGHPVLDSQTANGLERRAFPRIPTQLPVQVVRPDAFCDDTSDALLENISQSGALLITHTPIAIGEWIVIQPTKQGFGFGSEIVAIVERTRSGATPPYTLACRFPEPVDYSILRMFL